LNTENTKNRYILITCRPYFFSYFFSIFPYIMNLQEVSEESTHYFYMYFYMYKSILMVETLGIVLVIKRGELTSTLVRRSIYHSIVFLKKLPRLNFGQKIQMLFIKYKLWSKNRKSVRQIRILFELIGILVEFFYFPNKILFFEQNFNF
jgi:hypothetical protein